MRSFQRALLVVSVFLLAVTSFAAASPAPSPTAPTAPSLEDLRAAIFAPAVEEPQMPTWSSTCTASVICPHRGGTITCTGTSCFESTCTVRCTTASGPILLHCPSPCIEQ